MADTSVSDVKATFAGKDYTLRATVGALHTLERIFSDPYYIVTARMLNAPPRLTDVSEVFAAIALPHGEHSASGLIALIEFEKQAERILELRNGVAKAINAASPKKPAEGGGEGKADPQ